MLGSHKISEHSYKDKPLDLSYYLLLRTKEKLVLESQLKDQSSVLNPKYFTEKSKQTVQNLAQKPKLEKQIDEIREDIDEAFKGLERMLDMADQKEDWYDFPVAFVTNILYVCEKNGVNYLINNDKYLDILVKK